jgi:uncharacterized protein YukE
MPANEVQLEYQEIDATATALNNAADNLNPQILSLKTAVDNLLANGLFLQQTSPALQDSYDQFTIQLQKGVEQIAQFAKNFVGIKQTIEQLDSEIAAQIKKNNS